MSVTVVAAGVLAVTLVVTWWGPARRALRRRELRTVRAAEACGFQAAMAAWGRQERKRLGLEDVEPGTGEDDPCRCRGARRGIYGRAVEDLEDLALLDAAAVEESAIYGTRSRH